jgi:hypothetical protein
MEKSAEDTRLQPNHPLSVPPAEDLLLKVVSRLYPNATLAMCSYLRYTFLDNPISCISYFASKI